MLESIRKIGEAILSEEEPLEIQPLKRKKRRGSTLLAKIIFDLDSVELKFDFSFSCDEERAKEFLWVGNASAGQKPVLVLTVNNPEYLLNPQKKNKWAIKTIVDFISERKISDEYIVELCYLLSEILDKFFPAQKSLMSRLIEACRSSGHALKDIELYTVSVLKKGVLTDLVKKVGYKKFLEYVLYKTQSEDYPILSGTCYVCGERKEVLTNPSYPEGTILCMYNVDKAGFMSGIVKTPESLLKTHAICADCKKKLRLGLNFIEKHLRVQIGEKARVRLHPYLIPTFFGLKGGTTKELSVIREIFENLKSHKDKSLREIEKEINIYRQYECVNYQLNILFGKRVSSHFAFHFLIRDIPVTRLLYVTRESMKVSSEVEEIFGMTREKWDISFDAIYDIFPLIKSGTDVVWKPVVELFNAILTGSSYSLEEIIRCAVIFAKIHRYGVYEGTNIREIKGNADEAMCRGILKYNLLIKLMREIGVIKMREGEYKPNLYEVLGEVGKFFSSMKYTDWQKALFLLGFLVGKVGIEQYKKGDEKKAVLNKVRFEGMTVERVKRLANQVLEDLRNYRILNAGNESIYGYMKALLDGNLEKLRDPVDNVFYILSGYSFVTLQAITSRRLK